MCNVPQVSRKGNCQKKVVMTDHIYGHQFDMDPILGFSKKHNLIIIEDAAGFSEVFLDFMHISHWN